MPTAQTSASSNLTMSTLIILRVRQCLLAAAPPAAARDVLRYPAARHSGGPVAVSGRDGAGVLRILLFARRDRSAAFSVFAANGRIYFLLASMRYLATAPSVSVFTVGSTLGPRPINCLA